MTKTAILLGVLVLMVLWTAHYYLLPIPLVLALLLLRSKRIHYTDSQPHTVRLLCYNMFMRPNLWFIKHNPSDYKNERLDDFIERHIKHYDVLALQEVFSLFTLRQSHLIQRSYRYARIAGYARYLLWDCHWRFKIPFMDAGLLNVSKFPIVQWDSHTYRMGNQIDGYVPKHVLWTLLSLPGDRFLHLFNTHMQASHTHLPNMSSSDLIRCKQVEELAQFVGHKIKMHPHPALICGDFNLCARTYPLDYTRMMEILREQVSPHPLVNLFPAHEPTFGCVGERTLTHPADIDSSMCIDYIFYVGSTEGVTLDCAVDPLLIEGRPYTQLSDHAALSITLQWIEGEV